MGNYGFKGNLVSEFMYCPRRHKYKMLDIYFDVSWEDTLFYWINTEKTRRFLIYFWNFCHCDQKRVFMAKNRSFTLKAIFIIFIHFHYNFKWENNQQLPSTKKDILIYVPYKLHNLLPISANIVKRQIFYLSIRFIFILLPIWRWRHNSIL